MSVPGSVSHNFHEFGGPQVERARARHKDAARPQHLERAEVKFLVATASFVEIALGLGKRRRIENDGVVLSAGMPSRLPPAAGVVAKQIKVNIGSANTSGKTLESKGPSKAA